MWSHSAFSHPVYLVSFNLEPYLGLSLSPVSLSFGRVQAIYFIDFLVAQLVKNLPEMQETWVRSLGWEDPLEKGTATHSSILAWRVPWTMQSWDHKESDRTE